MYVLFSIPLPQASSSLSHRHLSPPSPTSLFSLSLVLSMYSPHSSPSAIPDILVSLAHVLERAPYYRAWKLNLALFELFATVLIRFIAAAATTAGRDRRFGFSFTTQLSQEYACRDRGITRYSPRMRIYIASNHSPTD